MGQYHNVLLSQVIWEKWNKQNKGKLKTIIKNYKNWTIIMILP